MSENIILWEKQQLISTNTSLNSDIRMPADEDDVFLDFSMPTVDDSLLETNNSNIKRFISPYLSCNVGFVADSSLSIQEALDAALRRFLEF